MTDNAHPENPVVRESISVRVKEESSELGATSGTKIVTAFVYSAGDLAEFRTVLSVERFGTYLKKVNNDPERAMRLYTWNTSLCSAFYGPLQSLEVSVRNTINTQLSKIYGPKWYDNPNAQLDMNAKVKIKLAKKALHGNVTRINPPDVIAALSFGFWVSLLGSGGWINNNRATRANYEMSLWRPALSKAFPHAKSLNRKKVYVPLDYLGTFRNRIAHHEPIFDRHLLKDYERILEIISWICPAKEYWTEHHSRVREIIAMEPSDSNLKF